MNGSLQKPSNENQERRRESALQQKFLAMVWIIGPTLKSENISEGAGLVEQSNFHVSGDFSMLEGHPDRGHC